MDFPDLRRFLYTRACVDCPEFNSTCPACDPDEQCQMVLQTCDACASYICAKTPSSGSSSSSPSGSAAAPQKSSNTGAIAGGVVAGLVVLIAAIMFLLWRFYYKPRKAARLQQALDAEKNGTGQFRSSTETLTSLAPSNVVRNSNIIPIAYIPGVTTRGAPSSHTDRSSIDTDSYRGSTAIISSAMMTAITARPNLVAISRSEDGATPTATAGTTASTTTTTTRPQYANAHSITIRGTGLQGTLIEEEEDEDHAVLETANKQATSGSSSRVPRIINLTKPKPVTAETIETRVSSASVISFQTATSGPLSSGGPNPFQEKVAGDRLDLAGSSSQQQQQQQQQQQGTEPAAEQRRSGDKTQLLDVDEVGGEHEEGSNYFSGTLKDLDGRISPFDDHYKL